MTLTYDSLHNQTIDAALANPEIKALVSRVLGNEVGKDDKVSNDPADPGGPTKDGVSLRYIRGVGLDLNHDGVVDTSDVALVTPDLAARLMVEDFFAVPGINGLPDCLWPFLVDFAYNSGPGRALINCQGVLNTLRVSASASAQAVWPVLGLDGRPGPKTVSAAHTALAIYGYPKVQNALCDDRGQFLRRLVDVQPSRAPDLNGWLTRDNSFRVKE